MLKRAGVAGTTCDGVFFTESVIPNAPVMEHITVEISRQNADLRWVKTELAKKASQARANCVMNFKYGQRKHPWWELLWFKWDTESWYGEGDAVCVP